MQMKQNEIKQEMRAKWRRKITRLLGVGAETAFVFLIFLLVSAVETLAAESGTGKTLAAEHGMVKTSVAANDDLPSAISDGRVFCEDQDGQAVECVNDYFYTTSGVRFWVCSPYRTVCVRVSYDDETAWSAYLPMDHRDDIYEWKAQADGHEYARYRFYEIREDGSAESIGEGDYYGIRFDVRPKLPEANLSMKAFQKRQDVYYVSAQPPELIVREGSAGDTYVFVQKENEQDAIKYPVDGTLSLRFLEGIYEVDVVYETEAGVQSVSGYPIRFIYDETPPGTIALELNGSSADRIHKERAGAQLIQSRNLVIKVRGEDELSGVDKFMIRAGEKIYAASSVTLKPGFCGDVEAWAVDLAGNESKHYRLSDRILIENTAPVIEAVSRQTSDKSMIDLTFSDAESGLCNIEIKAGEETIRRINFSEKEICRQHHLRIEVPAVILANEGKNIEIRCEDAAGNQAEKICHITFADTRAPRISWEGIEMGGITNKPVNLKLSIEDENLDVDSIKVKAQVTADGKSREIVVDSPEKLCFLEDGNYKVSIAAQDHFQNPAEKEIRFTVDTKAPVIMGLSGLHHSVLDHFSIKERLKNMFRDETPVRYSMYVNGKDYFEEDIEKPGEYTILVYAVDQAGNASRQQATFEIRDVKNDLPLSEAPEQIYNKRSFAI